MPLNFGGSGLFDTSLQERWKGVFNRRKEQAPIIQQSNSFYFNVPSTYTELTSITVNLQADDSVLLLFSAMCEQDDDNDQLSLLLRRDPGNNNVGSSIAHDNNASGNDPINISMGSQRLDSPGEGEFTYKLLGFSTSTNGDMRDIVLTAIVFRVS